MKSAYSCNAELLKFYREQLGLTQEELGEKAGYSRRLISKAEAGKSISSDTIADLAEALSAGNTTVHPEDIICDPVRFAKQYIDAFYIEQKSAIKTIRTFLDDHVVFQVQGDPAEIPFAGTFHGVDGVDEMIQKFFSVLEVPPNYDHTPNYQYVGQGNEVVIWGETWVQPIGHPIDSPVTITIRMRFRRGKMILFEDRYDLKAAEAAMAKLR